MESLRTCLLADRHMSDEGLATQLRAEIEKSRLMFSKKVIDDLLSLTIDFAYSSVYMISRKEYKDVFTGKNYDRHRKQIYCDVIIQQRYDRIEEILGEYLDLP